MRPSVNSHRDGHEWKEVILPVSRFKTLLTCCVTLCVVFLPIHIAGSAGTSDISPRSSQPVHVPFAAGERFTYAISWLTFQGGTAVMEVEPSVVVEGKPMFRFLTTARSSPIVTKFFPVDNRVESYVDPQTMLPTRLLFRRREGKKKNDFDVAFHHAKGIVLDSKDGQMETLPIPSDVQDILSCLYYLRMLTVLELGTSVPIAIHHDRKNYTVEVRIEGHERIETSFGTLDTTRVLAVLPFQGIFLNEGNVRVWVTNDARHIPVMMKAKVVIGSIVATLVDKKLGAEVP